VHETRLPDIKTRNPNVLAKNCTSRNLLNCFFKWMKPNEDALALTQVVGLKRARFPEPYHKLRTFADTAKKQVKDLLGKQGFKHLFSAGKIAFTVLFNGHAPINITTGACSVCASRLLLLRVSPTSIFTSRTLQYLLHKKPITCLYLTNYLLHKHLKACL